MSDLTTSRKVGALTREVRDKIRSRVKPGVSYLEIAETIESMIREAGARPAFPATVSVNDVAAHYSPYPGDESIIQEGDLVKVDFGAHINGFPSDNAFTVCAGCSHELVKVSEEALALAVSMCKPGVSVGEIGRAVEELISSHGFRPISNLSGHSMEQWSLRAGVGGPSVAVPGGPELSEGMIVAIEAFVTNGGGKVVESRPSSIYRLVSTRTRLPRAKQLLAFISEEFGTLPFCERWLPENMRSLLRLLVAQGSLHRYNTLREVGHGLVAQSETTVLVSAKPEILV